MGDEDQCGTEFALDFIEQVEHRRLHGNVQGGHRFIADHHVGIAGQGTGDAYSLFLAAGQLPRVAVIVVGCQFHGPEQPLHLLTHRGPLARLEPPDGPTDLLADGKGRIQGGVGILEYHLKLFDEFELSLGYRIGDVESHQLGLAVGEPL